MLKDPVCGKRMSRGKAHITIEYEGIAYALCCPRCQAEFEQLPKRYARPEWGTKVKSKKGVPQRK
ncbi:MAG: hypothetical protein FOGNACKC_03321 [Anaerolineae bacterium]|mgnify:CR=1 FL=1|nr:hypothetical protein [Anaerolineae bacterium]